MSDMSMVSGRGERRGRGGSGRIAVGVGSVGVDDQVVGLAKSRNSLLSALNSRSFCYRVASAVLHCKPQPAQHEQACSPAASAPCCLLFAAQILSIWAPLAE